MTLKQVKIVVKDGKYCNKKNVGLKERQGNVDERSKASQNKEHYHGVETQLDWARERPKRCGRHIKANEVVQPRIQAPESTQPVVRGQA